MTVIITVLTNDLTNILLDTFLFIRIVYYIDFRGWGTRVGVFFIVFFPTLVLFLLLPSFVGDLSIFS